MLGKLINEQKKPDMIIDKSKLLIKILSFLDSQKAKVKTTDKHQTSRALFYRNSYCFMKKGKANRV